MNHRKQRPAKNGPHREFCRLGYEDKRQGFPFRPEYETWLGIEQANYEAGRFMASNIFAAGLKPCAWNTPWSNRPPKVQYFLTLAREIVGGIRVGDAQPDDDDLTFTRPLQIHEFTKAPKFFTI